MNFDIKNKYTILIISGALAIISFIFLPIVSFLGISFSLFDLIKESSAMGVGLGGIGFLDIVGIIGLIGVIVGGFMKNKAIALISSIVAAAYLLLFLFEVGASFLGFGFWATLVLSAVNVFLSFTAE